MYELIIIGGVSIIASIAVWQLFGRKEPSYREKAQRLCAIAKENSLTHRMQAMHHQALADMYCQQAQLLNEEANGLDSRSTQSVSPLGDQARTQIAASRLADSSAVR